MPSKSASLKRLRSSDQFQRKKIKLLEEKTVTQKAMLKTDSVTAGKVAELKKFKTENCLFGIWKWSTDSGTFEIWQGRCVWP